MKVFREIEYAALRARARDRANAKERKREVKTGSSDLFAGIEADVQELSIDDIVEEQKALAKEDLLENVERFRTGFFFGLDIVAASAHAARYECQRHMCRSRESRQDRKYLGRREPEAAR